MFTPLSQSFKIMTKSFIFILSISIAGCSQPSDQVSHAAELNSIMMTDSTLILSSDMTGNLDQKQITDTNNIEEELIDYDHETYFLVIADTGTDYFKLQSQMYKLHSQFGIEVDTMNRYYNKNKNLIMLREDDEDDLYAGDYFPRRFPSQNLSLEYLDVYQSKVGSKTIALVTGIFEREIEADSVLKVINTSHKNSFKIKTEMYVGCMH